MCDDSFEDYFEENVFDCDKDYDEDLEDEADGEWCEGHENLIEESAIDDSSIIADNQSDAFDLADAMLWGMVGGAFYDAAREDNQQLKRAKSEDKKKK